VKERDKYVEKKRETKDREREKERKRERNGERKSEREQESKSRTFIKPSKKLIECGVSTPVLPFCLMCTTNPELKYIFDLCHHE